MDYTQPNELDEVETIAINPLENDLVLENLAKFIRRRDLLRCRLVNKQWRRFVTGRVRSEFQVRLGDASLGKYSSLSQFLALVLSSDQIPFSSYFLFNLKLSNPLLQKLFVICGSLIKYLKIELQNFDIVDIYGLRELLLHRAPNLQALSIIGCLPEEVLVFSKILGHMNGTMNLEREDFISSTAQRLPNLQNIQIEGRKIHPNFLMDLLRSSPNLRSIKSSRNWGIDRSTIIISGIRDTGNFRKLRAIHLNDIEDESLRILVDLSKDGLKLGELSFKILDVCIPSLFQDLLDLQKDTLTELNIGEVSGNEDIFVQFPVMKKLRKLTRSAVCKPEVKLGPFCFATLMPNIQELNVQAFADELNWSEYFADVNLVYHCHSMRSLSLPTNMSDEKQMEKLGKMFPCVKIISADSPRNPIIKKLWTIWPELQEINLMLTDKNEEIDSVFTGIPATSCDIINMTRSFEEVDIDSFRVGPSIANLRGLKKLHIETAPVYWTDSLYLYDKEPTCFLTNVTGYFGLAFLSNMEDMSLCGCEISDECCQYLAKTFQNFAKIFVSARNQVPVFDLDELQ